MSFLATTDTIKLFLVQLFVLGYHWDISLNGLPWLPAALRSRRRWQCPQCRPTCVAAWVFGDGSVLPSCAVLHNLRGRPTITAPQPHPTCRARSSCSPGQLRETGSLFCVSLCNRPSCQPCYSSPQVISFEHPTYLGLNQSLSWIWTIAVCVTFTETIPISLVGDVLSGPCVLSVCLFLLCSLSRPGQSSFTQPSLVTVTPALHS